MDALPGMDRAGRTTPPSAGAGHRRHRRRFLSAILTTGLLIALTATPASAATTTLVAPTVLSGSQSVSGTSITVSGAGVTATMDLTTSLSWSQAAAVAATFDPNLVRQGRPLDPVDAFSRTGSGTLKVDWTLANLTISWDGVSVGPFSPTFTDSTSCDLKAVGASPYSCSAASSQVDLIPVFLGYIGPYASVGLKTKVTVQPAGLETLRTASFGGLTDGTANLTLGESPITDPLTIPCTAGKGDTMTYALGTFSTSPGIVVETDLVFEVGAAFPDPIIPFTEDRAAFATSSLPLQSSNTTIGLSGQGVAFDMGAVLPNNIPPVADPAGPYSGDEGSPIAFNGAGSSSICGFPTLRWDFSDGGVAFGKTPQHTFADNGSYSGLLTATDATGLSSTATFSISVANLAPSVSGGPDRTTLWGVPVSFQANGSDPSPVDQAVLLYSWTFGDPYAPVGASGQAVSHTYSHPGTYTAEVTVADKDGASASDQVAVTVAKRATTIAYTGPNKSLPSKQVTLTASLVDELNQPVVGRTVVFSLGSQTVSAATDGSGVATATIKLTQKKGTYPVSVTFAGDGYYLGSNHATTFLIGM
jgi:PKD repeat protein